ncbi:MAG TPA: MFS transporter, partial [Ktedonobacteraceae bacterium]|nr:MFS transporter [Ktedonobacteraceae bacterium]
ALLLLIAWFGLPETRSRETLEARMPVVTAYLSFLRLPRSLSLSLLIGVAFAGYFGFISGSPFVLQGQLGVSSTVYAVAFTAAAVLLLAGSLLAGRLASALGAERLLLLGCMGLALSGVLAFGLNTLAGPPSVPGFILAMGCFAFCFGIAIPNAFAIGLQNAGVVAGTGTAILGSAQMLGGSIGSTGIGLLPTSAAAAVGLFAIVTGLITAILYVVSRR